MHATETRTTALADAGVEAINQWPLDKVATRLKIKKTIPVGKVDEAIEEYRKYMILIALGNKRLAMTSRYMDEAWHCHVLFTRDYATFCEQVFGFFVHHEPATIENPITDEARRRFVEVYEVKFGKVPGIWAEANDYSDTACAPGGMGCDCSGK